MIELYRAMTLRGLNVVILLHQNNGPLCDFLLSKKIQFQVLPVRVLAGESPKVISIIFAIAKNIIKFSQFIKRNRFEIIHGNDIRINLSWSIPAKLCKKKFIWHQRTILSSSALWMFIPILCDHFVGISEAVMSSAPTNIPKKKKTLVTNPFRTAKVFDRTIVRQALTNEYSIRKDRFLVGYVGRLVKYKNLDFLLRGISRVNKTNKEQFHLIVVGIGDKEYLNEIKKIIAEHDMLAQVTFTGFSDNPEKIIAGLDLLVAASTVDAFGRSLVEAMLQETPVLAASAGGHREIVTDGETGLLFSPNDIEDFTSKLCYLRNNAELRSKIAKAAAQSAQLRYSVCSHRDEIISIYRKVLPGSRAVVK